MSGQSAGAASAVLLMGAPAAEGLFRRVIAQSVPAGLRTPGKAAAVTAAHGVDIPFAFGTGGSRFAARFLGSPPPGFAPLAERIRAAWTAFAATGDPGRPRSDLEHRRTRVWDTVPADT